MTDRILWQILLNFFSGFLFIFLCSFVIWIRVLSLSVVLYYWVSPPLNLVSWASIGVSGVPPPSLVATKQPPFPRFSHILLLCNNNRGNVAEQQQSSAGIRDQKVSLSQRLYHIPKKSALYWTEISFKLATQCSINLIFGQKLWKLKTSFERNIENILCDSCLKLLFGAKIQIAF